VCQFVFILFCPDPVNVMIDTKDRNETAIERTQKNKNANKKVVRKRKLPAGKVSITENQMYLFTLLQTSH
jgi:hypothetical protein